MTLFFYAISISLMILFPLGLAIAFRRRVGVPWALFLIGVATFIGSQLYHIPINNWLTDLGIIGPVAADEPHLVRTALILGLSAGLSESLARAAGFWVLFRRRAAERWEDGVMVGLGHGGIEAMGLIAIIIAATVTSLWALRGTDLSTLNLPAARAANVAEQLAALEVTTWQAFLPLVERMLTVAAHVLFSMLAWMAFRQRNPLYWLAAVIYHTALDTTAVLIGASFDQPAWSLPALVVVITPGLVWLWRRWPRQKAERPLTLPFGVELRLFAVALRKELMEQWRTKRALVVLAVFVLFGLAAPLTAKYTPQLLTMIEGAEQFAELIPEPTQADALREYIENLTLFGFAIVILVGMGAVAGEKERGQTPMILSKPLPRWAYLLSKFTAQALVYAAAFLTAGLGAYYYTLILFEPFQLGPFLWGNALLLLWLLTYTAVTLLGSTIGKTIGQGAGIALAGAALLLISGRIPLLAPFAPSGLVVWAGQLGLATDTSAANGGTLVANVVLIVILLIGSVAVFEAQEL